MEEVILKVECQSQEQAELLKELLLKVVPQFEGKVFLERK
jgi:hypothetical protein